MFALLFRPEFFDIYLDLAVEFRLPLRLAGSAAEARAGFPFRRLAADEGVVFADHVLAGVGSRALLEQAIADARPGVTEISFHPAVDTGELQAFAPDWSDRVDDHAALTDESLAAKAEAAGVELISYRPLRDLMRS